MDKRISEIIKIDDIRQWNNNTVTITAGTGTGKSYFIKNILYAFAKKNNKKILMLIHRTNCVNQFQNEINKDKKIDVIDIHTYQKLEFKEIHKYKNLLDQYQYIVCDEFHYFLSDAAFNKTTDISLNLILSQNVTKIFMSATGDYIKQYLNRKKKIKTIDYSLPIKYKFENLVFFNYDTTLVELAKDAIKTSEKIIFFIQSAQKAYGLYLQFEKYSLFNCSRNNKQYFKKVDQEKVMDMLVKEKFEENILITTTCMDAGINLIDTDIKHIVCDVKDVGSLIQCIGRKRIKSLDDYVNIYIKTITNKQLGGIETQLNKKIEMADYLKENGIKNYILKYPRQNDYSNIIYDDPVEENNKCTKKINEMMYFKCKIDLLNINKMKQLGNFGYCKYLANIFGFYNNSQKYNYIILEEQKEKDILINYLENIKGTKLFSDERKELKKIFNKAGLKARTMGRHTLNGWLKDLGLPYTINHDIDKRRKLNNGNKNLNRGKRYWIVGKLIYKEE
ncbi:DEAD/DEAH box helicase family protein [Clostridium tyrobutyricum]|uniref:DEAD/DEAH box helicase family protein n=1 Tax=Clostridium tyrobutyricum TaxID=1519 RepID=UPI001C391905|nr:DEAD/DEAH box helicase family protein [Clostridium tyrobutyricum]MBV4418279.1 DEAD/DEAH box helicase family protein [Clostridium tyrobutyricum]